MDEVRWIAGAPPPPPQWRRWLLPIALLVPTVIGCVAILYVGVIWSLEKRAKEAQAESAPPPVDHLGQLELAVVPLVDRRILLDADPRVDEDTMRADPVLAGIKRQILTHSSKVLQGTPSPAVAEDARALRAFVLGAPLPVGTSPLPCSLWALRALQEGAPQRAFDVVAGCRKEGRWGDLAVWVHAHCLLALHKSRDPFEPVPPLVGTMLDSLSARFRERASLWMDRAAACDDPEQAERHLAKALEILPGEPVILARLIDLAERRGLHEHARRLRGLAKAIAVDPIASLVARAQYAQERGDFARTRDAFAELCAIPGVPPSVRQRRARFLLRTGAATEALADAEFVHATDPMESTLALLADALTASGRPEEALTRAAGDGPAVRSARSRALRALGRLEEAIAEAAEAADWGEVAVCSLQLGRIEDAEKTAQRAQSALAYDVLARIALSRGRLEAAWSWNEAAIRDDPFRATSHALRGVLHFREDRLGDATESFQSAIRIDPGCSEAWRGLAEIRSLHGNFGGALDALQQIPASAPKDLAFHLLRARLRTKQGLLRDAVGDLDEAIRLDPSPFFLILDRAELKLELEDFAGVRADAELARTKIRRASQPWKLIALADLAEGKPEAAEKGFDETLRRSPKDIEARIARATLRLTRKDRAGAREDLAAAVEADFGDAEALYRLLQLDVEDGHWLEVLQEAARFGALHPKDERAAQARQWFNDAAAALR